MLPQGYSEWNREVMRQMDALGKSGFLGGQPMVDSLIGYAMGLTPYQMATALMGRNKTLFTELLRATEAEFRRKEDADASVNVV